MEKVTLFTDIPQEVLSNNDPILLVMENSRDLPPFIRNWPRFDFLFADYTDWRRIKRIPERIRHIFLSQGIPNSIVAKLSQMIDETIKIWRFGDVHEKMFQNLARLIPKNHVPEKYLTGEEKPAAPRILKTPQQEKPQAREPKKRGPKNPKGVITKFITQNADFSAQRPFQEAKRLFELAQKEGIFSSVPSLYMVFSRLKKEQEKTAGKTVPKTAPPAPEVQPKVIAQAPEAAPVTTLKLKQDISAPAEIPKPTVEETEKIQELLEPPSKEKKVISLPLETRGGPGETWFTRFKSLWVSFIHRADSSEAGNGNGKDSRFRSKWVGFITGKKDQKWVFPNDPVVEKFIDDKFQETKSVPIDIPCFLELRSTVFLVTEIDFERLQLQKDTYFELIDSLIARVQSLESRSHYTKKKLEEYEKQIAGLKAPQKMVVVFDFDNFMKSCQRLDIGILPGQLVDDLAWHRTHMKREVVEVVIVDFYGRAHQKFWKGLEGFRLYEVPRSTAEENLTDQYVYQATLESVQKLPAGSLAALVSSDGDFKPLILDLKNKHFQTMVVGNFPEDMSEDYLQSAKYRFNLKEVQKAFPENS